MIQSEMTVTARAVLSKVVVIVVAVAVTSITAFGVPKVLIWTAIRVDTEISTSIVVCANFALAGADITAAVDRVTPVLPTPDFVDVMFDVVASTSMLALAGP